MEVCYTGVAKMTTLAVAVSCRICSI